ncbi:Protein kinase-like domain-containing protein [Cynara cardunculus var. scolymus]|uniref:Protein kinase-like domain-containing protein n=1 Tax=Cynara cardunculus var. scolymus TaxID=59895 RepID=A0A118JXQ7_CYNCS|nr:Protein kinase-like domain-containing protein [Cynara cardunculus var. scolymus]
MDIPRGSLRDGTTMEEVGEAGDGAMREYNESEMLLVVALGIGLISLVITLIRKLKWRRKTNVNVEIVLKNHEFLDPKRYTYSQIKKMTNSFEINQGQGGFGSVYKGELSNGNLVAVKVLI